ncbi:hypothetical protein [Catellatospora sp. NPDC049609]|uniref:hypothetical protein n=1 Tax=Catellatospora sp. NPDC049609 TaxID=3155505 RepID=UPI003437B14D
MTAHPVQHAPRPQQPAGAGRARRRADVAVAAGLALLAMITCAAATRRSSLSTAQATVVAGDLRAMYERIQGSVEQRTAALLLAHVARQEPIRECMASSGFRYALAPFADPYQGRTRLLLPAEVSAIVDPGAQEALELVPQTLEQVPPATVAHDPSYDRLSAAKQRLYDDSVLMCEPPIEDQPDTITPALSGDLDAEFLAMLRRVGDDQEVASRMEYYASCMRQRGLPVRTVGELHAAVTAKFHDDSGVPLRPESSLMPKAVAYQQDAVRADAGCRTPAWTGAMTLAQGELAAFAREHADELAALDAEWADMISRAGQARAKLA